VLYESRNKGEQRCLVVAGYIEGTGNYLNNYKFIIIDYEPYEVQFFSRISVYMSQFTCNCTLKYDLDYELTDLHSLTLMFTSD